MEVLLSVTETSTSPDNITNLTDGIFQPTFYSNRSLNNPPPPPSPTSADEFLTVLDSAILPVVLILGIVGNALVVVIFLCSPLKTSGLSHYLVALGVSDFIYIVSSTVVWVSKPDRIIHLDLERTRGVCQINTFSLLLSRFLTTWYLFAAHAERFISHYNVCRARVWCTTFRSKCIILTIFVFSMVGFMHHAWTHVVEDLHGMKFCMPMPQSMKFMTELRKVEIISAVFLPAFLIFVCDIALCVNIISRHLNNITAHKSRPEAGAGRDCELKGVYVSTESHRSVCVETLGEEIPLQIYDLEQEKARTTLTVVVAGVVFIAMVLPASVQQVKSIFSSGKSGFVVPGADERFAMVVFEDMVKINSVCKIFIYLVLLRGFRLGFRHICHRMVTRRKSRPANVEETNL